MSDASTVESARTPADIAVYAIGELRETRDGHRREKAIQPIRAQTSEHASPAEPRAFYTSGEISQIPEYVRSVMYTLPLESIATSSG
ncbi:MAG: hypothetical protein WBQ10_02190 [Terriglobales bacterium]